MTIAASIPRPGTMKVEEFQAFLETRPKDERWQLIEGVAVMMNPPTYVHQRISHNFLIMLDAAFSAQNLDLFAYTEGGVRAPGVDNFQPRPDVVVVSGSARYSSYEDRFYLVAEVLSPTNTVREIDLKLQRYREVPENAYIFVVDSRRVSVKIYERAGEWQMKEFTSVHDTIEVQKFGFRCSVGDLYRGTPLGPKRR
jgi:Uma2 family endonuclease